MDQKIDQAFRDVRAEKRQRRRKVLKHIGLFTLLLGLFAVYRTSWVKLLLGNCWTRASLSRDKCSGPRRTFKRHEIFAPISGSFNLYDELDLSTVAGPIDVVIYPQSGCGPSILNVHSAAGPIDITFARAEEDGGVDQGALRYSRFGQSIPGPFARRNRPIVADIATKAGGVSADLFAAAGSSVTLSSISGTVNSKIYVSDTASNNNTITRIHTSTKAGSQFIKVLISPFCPKKACSRIDGIEALHTVTGAGSMKLSYPPQWRGNFHAKIDGSGVVDAVGEDLEFETRSNREVVAWRGKNGDDAPTVEALAQGAGSITFNADGEGVYLASE